jgi:hypothetical protein
VIILVLASPFFSPGCTAEESPPLSLDDIIHLQREGIKDEVIIEKIRLSGTQINLTVNEIIGLKRKGISDSVIKEILQSKEQPAKDSPETPSSPQDSDLTPIVSIEVTSPLPSPPAPSVGKSNPDAAATVPPTSEDVTIAPELTTGSNSNSGVVINRNNLKERRIMRILTEPSKAEVYLDGAKVGLTPYYTNMGIEGKHKLVLKKKYYNDMVVELDLREESIRDLHLPLQLTRPMVELVWNMDTVDSLHEFTWSIANCTASGDSPSIPLDLSTEEHQPDGNRAILLCSDEAPLSSTKNAKACLQCSIWMKTHLQGDSTINSARETPDLVFLIRDILLTKDRPVALAVELQRNEKFPGGVRVILKGDSGQIVRL